MYPHRALKLLLVFLFVFTHSYGAVLSSSSLSASPGQTLIASVTFDAQSQQVSALQFDLSWDAGIDAKVVTGANLRGSSKLLFGAGLGSRSARCLIAGTNFDQIPQGAILKLFIIADAAAQPGSARVHFTNMLASDANGNSIPFSAPDLEVRIQGNATGSLQPETLLNAASLLPGSVAPGEVVTLFDFAPEGATLLFNGRPAPVLYAESNQINAVVPFELDTNAPVSVE
jgi:hypothetical protein